MIKVSEGRDSLIDLVFDMGRLWMKRTPTSLKIDWEQLFGEVRTNFAMLACYSEKLPS